jgi:hypothetical protein
MAIVVSGPIASGKSAVARAVRQEFERRGSAAAIIDLDVVYDMLSVARVKDDDAMWLVTRQAAAALTDAFLSAGVDVVIVDGEFLTRKDREAYVRSIRAEVEPRFVTLTVSVDEAMMRAESDATRTVSRDPVFLRQHYAAARVATAETPSTDLLLDTESLSVDETARLIARWAETERQGSRGTRK